MPATHVLKTPEGHTVTDVITYRRSGWVAVTLRGSTDVQAYHRSQLKLVPRAELLVGQVLFA